MKFYNRENELNLLRETDNSSRKSSKMTIIVGRRRIGKTSLIIKSVEQRNYIYLFVSKKNEPLLCSEFQLEIEEKTGLKIWGEVTRFRDLFEFLMIKSRENPVTLIIDEFQEFSKINESIYSDMQNSWDKYKDSSRMHLILCGSIYSLMKRIFENSREPLFGRANERIHLKPFRPEILKKIMVANKPDFTNKDLLAFYILTGGIPKYIELFADKSIYSLDGMIDEIFRNNSLLIEEGKNLLIEEFGKEYNTYFSILSLIASSKNSRNEIESILMKNVGGYLDRLEKEYGIIRRIRPVFSRPDSRVMRYSIDDNFLNFWFRFVYHYRSAIEIGNFEYVKDIVRRDFSTFSGRFLEKYYIEKLSDEKSYSLIGNYWGKGNNNEIDIIAINEMKKRALIAEVKLNPAKINLDVLKIKSHRIINHLKGYKIEYKSFSIEEM